MDDTSFVGKAGDCGPVERSLREKILAGFSPDKYDIVNDSPAHAGHAGAMGGAKGESHFSVRIVSRKFTGMTRLQRNRAVHKLLAEELREQVHALTLTLQSPDEAGQDGQ